MKNYITPPKSVQPQNTQKNNPIDFKELAPKVIHEVALKLMPDRPVYSEDDAEIRFGNNGSFKVNKRDGTFSDYERDEGGGLLRMICHLLNLEHNRQAVDWLKDNGFVDGSFTPSQRPSLPKIQRRTQASGDMFKRGLQWWEEAEPIGVYQYHPARYWSRKRDIILGYDAFPSTIRYHKQEGLLVVALAPFDDFVSSYPNDPEPKQFHLIAIDRKGNKRGKFRGDDKRTFGQPGEPCFAVFGNPNAERMGIAEGIADALSLISDFPKPTVEFVMASLTTFDKIVNSPSLVKTLAERSLSGQDVCLFADNDEAGEKAEQRLIDAIEWQGGEVLYVEDKMAKDPAEAKIAGGAL